LTKSQSSRKGKGTRTSAFGSPGRANHDSTDFYDSRLYQDQQPAEPVSYHETQLPEVSQNKLFCKSSESMDELPDHSVHLMVTSPPYNASKEYDEDLTLGEYRDLLRSVMAETYRVLVTGGRACINLANLGRKPYLPLHAFLIEDMLSIGYLMRGEIIWDKAGSAGSSTAWGSWLSASNPVLRDVHEYIMVFCKETFSRPAGDRVSTIQREDFLAWTKSVWSFPSVSARQIGHPAPFPEELPRRLIELYTYQDEVVLDPFCGSGTSCLAALRAQRTYVGYDTHQEYIALAKTRLAAANPTED
jgi:DNA modification methylase